MDLKEVCRTCLLPSESMISIYCSVQVLNSEYTKLPIVEILKNFTKILVSENDGLPDNICCNCLNKIHSSYAFKLKLEKSEVIWKKLMENEKNVNAFNTTDMKLIKTEKTDDCITLSDNPLKKTSLPKVMEPGIQQETSFVQEVKEEPEIEINIEVEDYIETFSEENCNKSDFPCSICSKSFKRKQNLQVHMITHTDERPFQCEKCPKTFRSSADLKGHTRVLHGDERTMLFECAVCSKCYNCKSELKRHMIMHSKDRPFLCEICSKTFRRKPHLIAHMRTTHDSGIGTATKFKCMKCTKLYNSKYLLKRHMITHTEERPFQCDICKKLYRYKNNLTLHMKSIHGTANATEFKCAICSKSFVGSSSLKVHMRKHTGEKPIQCQLCPNKFQWNSGLTAHMQTEHADETAMKFKCSMCSKLYFRQHQLDRHMRIHTEVRSFQCEVCSKKFRREYNLMIHVQMVHADGKTIKFKCVTCSVLCRSKYQLIRHMKVHTEGRPFQCELCPKNYRFKGDFAAHMKIAHTDGITNKTVFKCVICSKLFGRKGSLKDHMKIHSDEMPFSCEMCNKKFRFKSNLKAHMQIIHAYEIMNRPKFRCSTCSKSFGCDSSLKKHMKIHTEENSLYCEICNREFRHRCNLMVHMKEAHADGKTTKAEIRCSICSKLFGRKSSLNEHMRIHTEEKPFQCELCQKDFRFKSNFTVHMKMLHSADSTTNSKIS